MNKKKIALDEDVIKFIELRKMPFNTNWNFDEKVSDLIIEFARLQQITLSVELKGKFTSEELLFLCEVKSELPESLPAGTILKSQYAMR